MNIVDVTVTVVRSCIPKHQCCNTSDAVDDIRAAGGNVRADIEIRRNHDMRQLGESLFELVAKGNVIIDVGLTDEGLHSETKGRRPDWRFVTKFDVKTGRIEGIEKTAKKKSSVGGGA